MVALPQTGGCLCGDVRYRLEQEPVLVYACHCTDCQTMSGASFTLSMLVSRNAFEVFGGEIREHPIELPDGRVKRYSACPRCATRLWNPARDPTLHILEPGTLDDTSWVAPVAHIWARSAQKWIAIPDAALRIEEGPGPGDWLEVAKARGEGR